MHLNRWMANKQYVAKAANVSINERAAVSHSTALEDMDLMHTKAMSDTFSAVFHV